VTRWHTPEVARSESNGKYQRIPDLSWVFMNEVIHINAEITYDTKHGFE